MKKIGSVVIVNIIVSELQERRWLMTKKHFMPKG